MLALTPGPLPPPSLGSFGGTSQERENVSDRLVKWYLSVAYDAFLARGLLMKVDKIRPMGWFGLS